MAIKIDRVDENYKHRFPDGNVYTYHAVVYEVRSSDRSYRAVIGFTEKGKYGKLRTIADVFINGHHEAEFVGTDDYDMTGNLVALIKGPDGDFMHIKKIDQRYAGFNVVDHSSQISEGKKGCAALLVSSEDHRTMIQHALIQREWRRARGEWP
jgi:predicted transcriptional regulator